MLRIQENA